SEEALWRAATGFFFGEFVVGFGLGSFPRGGETGDIDEHALLCAGVDFEIALELALGLLVEGVDLYAQAFVLLLQVFELMLHLAHGVGFDLEPVAEVTAETGELTAGTDEMVQRDDREDGREIKAEGERAEEDTAVEFHLGEESAAFEYHGTG